MAELARRRLADDGQTIGGTTGSAVADRKVADLGAAGLNGTPPSSISPKGTPLNGTLPEGTPPEGTSPNALPPDRTLLNGTPPDHTPPNGAGPAVCVVPPHEYLVDEVAEVLTLTSASADDLIRFATDLTTQLPGTFAALGSGEVDYCKARTIWRGTDQVGADLCDGDRDEGAAQSIGADHRPAPARSGVDPTTGPRGVGPRHAAARGRKANVPYG